MKNYSAKAVVFSSLMIFLLFLAAAVDTLFNKAIADELSSQVNDYSLRDSNNSITTGENNNNWQQNNSNNQTQISTQVSNQTTNLLDRSQSISSSNIGENAGGVIDANGYGGSGTAQANGTNIVAPIYQSSYKTATQAPNLPWLNAYLNHNPNSCVNQVGGGASGSNGMFGAGINLVFSDDDENCKMLQQVQFLVASKMYVEACTLIMIFDEEENDGLFKKALDKSGSDCTKIIKSDAAPSQLALDTQRKLDSIQTPAFSQFHADRMQK